MVPRLRIDLLPAGLQVLTVHVPGRPLVSANLVFLRGAGDEPRDLAGATVLAARAMTEGTERYPGVELIEAAERLGATLHVEATWDAFVAGVEVAAPRLEAALELLAELVERPTFPDEDVTRLRDELATLERETHAALQAYSRILEAEEREPFRALQSEIEAYWGVLDRTVAWPPARLMRPTIVSGRQAPTSVRRG